jgi:hypothetical protein
MLDSGNRAIFVVARVPAINIDDAGHNAAVLGQDWRYHIPKVCGIAYQLLVSTHA